MSINITGIVGINGGVQLNAPGTSPPQTYYSNLFDGNGDYLWTPNTSSEFTLGTGDFTVEFWIKFVSLTQAWSTALCLRSNNGGNSAGDAGSLYFAGDQAVAYTFGNGQTVGDGTSFGTNSWEYVTLVRQSGVMKYFLNGIQSGSNVNNTINISATRVLIGTDGFGSTGSLNGYISNLRVVKGTALYSSNFTPPTAPLTAISGTSLLTCQSATFIDNSPNNFTITSVGDVAISTDNPFN